MRSPCLASGNSRASGAHGSASQLNGHKACYKAQLCMSSTSTLTAAMDTRSSLNTEQGYPGFFPRTR